VKGFSTAFALAAALAAAGAPAVAQDGSPHPRRAAATYPRPADFPHEDRAAVAEGLARARAIAGPDLFADFIHRCIVSPRYHTRVAGLQHDGWVQPTRLFDNLYAVGQNAVAAHALTTSAGIVLFDTLNSEDEARTLLVPNLEAMGLDPKAIRYIVITHAHGDHYGGARYLQRTYGAHVIASAIDWAEMDRQRAAPSGPFADIPPPDHDIAVADGESLTVGDTTLRFYVTPGHTPGVLSTIFKVSEGGAAHTVGYFGGTGGGGPPQALRSQIRSLQRWREITQAAGVDVLIANHPLHDHALENNELLRYRRRGDPNPYVVGADRYQRYMQVQEACARVGLVYQGLAE
jgi:metallo-beta-lactamase class B